MEVSAHYYGLYALALACGIKNSIACRIAYASQYVDDALTNTIVFDAAATDGPSAATGLASCHSYYSVKDLYLDNMIFNTSAFHFFPGNMGNSFSERMLCREDPQILRDLTAETVSAPRLSPERLGILLHVYMDSFSHQGFSGLMSKENDIKDLVRYGEIKALSKAKLFIKMTVDRKYRYFDRFVPAYGHAQAYHYPDIPDAIWGYAYDHSDGLIADVEAIKIDNAERYRRAFSAVAGFLQGISDRNVYSSAGKANGRLIEEVISLMIRKEGIRRKNRRLLRFMKDLLARSGESPEVPRYRRSEWMKEAFVNFRRSWSDSRVVTGAVPAPEFESTAWFLFMQEMQWYRGEFVKRLRERGLILPV